MCKPLLKVKVAIDPLTELQADGAPRRHEACDPLGMPLDRIKV